MLDYLKKLAARLRGRPFGPPPLPDDPFAGVRQPHKRGPADKSTSAAVIEPVENEMVRAHGAVRKRTGR